jgi:hypothetical protein
MDHVATGASPVPPKRSKAELTQPPNSYRQPPNPCHSDAARSAKEESAVLAPEILSRSSVKSKKVNDASAYIPSSEIVLKNPH